MRRYVWIGWLVGMMLMPAAPAAAQDLIDLLRMERLRVQAGRMVQDQGVRAMPRPPERLAVPSDTLWQRLAGEALPDEPDPEPERPAVVIDRWRLVRKLERRWFEERFAETAWAFLGSNTFSPLDTLRTRDLRARLEAHFGPPTLTLVELEDLERRGRDGYIEFEYWFVLNDSIPFVVTDVNGPLERGLVVATDHRYRDQLFGLRQAFLGRLIDDPRRAPYVDYYYHFDTGFWYRTGYTGSAFFMERIRRPAFFRGRPFLRPDGR